MGHSRWGFVITLFFLSMQAWSGEGVVIGDREWLQPADFVNYSFNQVEAVCPPPSGACSGSLPDSDIDLTGHRWASMSDIAELFNMAGIVSKPPITESELDDPPIGDPPDPDQLLLARQDVLFGYFEPTYTFFEDGPQNVLSVVSRDRADVPGEYQGLVIQYGYILDGDSSVDSSDDGTGIWFWRQLGETTEPPAEEGVTLSGTVTTREGVDICAIVLASGQYTFSCDPVGSYFLRDIPSEPDGTVKRQIYARGFFPKVDVLQRSEEESVTVGRVTLNRASGCPDYNLSSDPLTFPQSSGKRHSVSGRVLLQSTDTPVCAFVLANGSYMYSCDGEGSFSLDFPLDENGQYTLQSYADGFAPSVRVFNEFDNPQEVRMARAIECRSAPYNDPNTVVVNGKEWLQPNLFENYTRVEISALCPQSICSGTLPGSSINLTGYRWATVEDLNALFNYYLGTDEMGPGEDFYIGGPRSLDAFVLDGWRLIDSDENSLCPGISGGLPGISGGLRNGQAFVCDDGPNPFGGKGDYFVTAIEYANGGWFWRPAE